MPHYVDVIIPLALQNYFTYEITSDQLSSVQIGTRITVPFGKSRIYTAVVVKIHQTKPQHYAVKSIDEVIDQSPMISLQQLRLWAWIADYYLCSIGEVCKAALPSLLLLESESFLSLDTSIDIEDKLTDNQYLIIEALKQNDYLKISEIKKILEVKNIIPIVNQLVVKGYLKNHEYFTKTYKPKMLAYLEISPEARQNLNKVSESLHNKTPKQYKAFLALATRNSPIQKKIFLEEQSVSASIIKSLVTKGWVAEQQQQQDRIQYGNNSPQGLKKLSDAQSLALAQIKASLTHKKVVLLRGVTSSGKTEVYKHLIEEQLASGGQVLYMLPEIALTIQIINKLQMSFGEQVVVYHSKYNIQERLETWQKIRRGDSKARLIIGTRSAIWLHFNDLKLIIVDEEHDVSYKQKAPAPRFNARDTAIYMTGIHDTKVVLGSATPSMESYYNAKNNKYGLVELSERYQGAVAPTITIIDLKESHKKKKMQLFFSKQLLKEIDDKIFDNKQVIIYQNRRGYAPVVECLTCGEVPQCANCDVSLTLHTHAGVLKCHYCGYSIAQQQKCLSCSSPNIDTKGIGTQQVEEALQSLRPALKISRLDSDTTSKKGSYEKIITDFTEQKHQVLIGTQMISKGLDFKNVSLVAIINADAMLYQQDFRASERAFQNLLQVSGRAGRGSQSSNVIIQTYNPTHKIFKKLIQDDYISFYEDEIIERKQFIYPPYCKMVVFTLKHKSLSTLDTAADWLTSVLRNNFSDNVLGPEYPSIQKIKNQYIKMIYLKKGSSQSYQEMKLMLKKIIGSFGAVGTFKSVRLTVDIDYHQ